MRTVALQRASFLLFLSVVTAGFLWLLRPFFGTIMWAIALAMLFSPLYRRFCNATGQRTSLAALITMLLCLVVVVLPLTVIGASLVQDIVDLAEKIRSGQIDFAAYFEQVRSALPRWITNLLDRTGVGQMSGMRLKIQSMIGEASQTIASQAVNIGQNTLQFVTRIFLMLYLLFFMLRDGASLSKTVRQSLPLARSQSHYLLNQFTTVTRATIKGNVVVAAAQGALGGIAFSLLGVQGALVWGVMMAFLSLVPAVGAALIWFPVSLYLLAIGATWKGIGLIAFGVLVIGLVDNLLRPILVGKETRLPDYLVLMSKVGGISVFGNNGFVIGPVIAALFVTAWKLFTDAEDDTEAPKAST